MVAAIVESWSWLPFLQRIFAYNENVHVPVNLFRTLSAVMARSATHARSARPIVCVIYEQIRTQYLTLLTPTCTTHLSLLISFPNTY